MRTDELDYDLPAELIAQEPVEPRDASRLLVVARDGGVVGHRRFHELDALLDPGDVVVLNRTRVLPARVRGTRPGGGGAEVLLLEPLGDGTWAALARPLRRLPTGSTVTAGRLVIHVVERLDGGRVRVRPEADGALDDALAEVGEMPLPPYIRTALADPERYQTVYARTPGSAAAPTAGLHLTPALLARLRARHDVHEVELDVGLDTFRPVQADDLDAHVMHEEAYRVEPATRAALVAAHGAGRRIVAVGTTTVRVLETIADPAAPDAGRTGILIQPGHRFRLVDALVTNFHLPRSTLIALVMALAGVETTRAAYAEAIAQRYRFYSFGDAMLVR